MPTYILLSSLTPEGSQTLHKDPDRLDAVKKEISEFGCKVVTQYAVLGGYDFLTIVDAPDNETVAHMSVDRSSRGTVKITTLPAILVAQLKAKLPEPIWHSAVCYAPDGSEGSAIQLRRAIS
jgi:uncharacterized protein with GYD domain